MNLSFLKFFGEFNYDFLQLPKIVNAEMDLPEILHGLFLMMVSTMVLINIYDLIFLKQCSIRSNQLVKTLNTFH